MVTNTVLRYCFASNSWELQLVVSRFAPSYWGIAISRLLALRQAIGKLQFFDVSSCWGIPTCRVLLYPKLLSNYNRDAPVLYQARGELQFEMFCFAPSYWGITILRLLSCVKLFRNYNLYGFAVRQALVELYFARFCFAPSEGLQFRSSGLVPSCWGIPICRVLLCIRPLGTYNLQGPVLPQASGGLQLTGAIPVRHSP